MQSSRHEYTEGLNYGDNKGQVSVVGVSMHSNLAYCMVPHEPSYVLRSSGISWKSAALNVFARKRN